MFGQPALEPQVLHKGSENIRRVRWLEALGERCVFVDLHRRTHVCTVAGHSRAVKYQEPDAPKMTG